MRRAATYTCIFSNDSLLALGFNINILRNQNSIVYFKYLNFISELQHTPITQGYP